MSGRTFGGGTAVLVLEDGRVFRGIPFGAVGQTLGEAVFSTGMTGYQETLTDPSYHRQIVVATAPQIGNTGWNQEDNESVGPTGEASESKIWVAGFVVRDPSRRTSSWRATGSLQDELERQDVVGLAGIDTRALVRHLRTRGRCARACSPATPSHGKVTTSTSTPSSIASRASRRCSAPTSPVR